jgi:hypothetical protein
LSKALTIEPENNLKMANQKTFNLAFCPCSDNTSIYEGVVPISLVSSMFLLGELKDAFARKS